MNKSESLVKEGQTFHKQPIGGLNIIFLLWVLVLCFAYLQIKDGETALQKQAERQWEYARLELLAEAMTDFSQQFANEHSRTITLTELFEEFGEVIGLVGVIGMNEKGKDYLFNPQTGEIKATHLVH